MDPGELVATVRSLLRAREAEVRVRAAARRVDDDVRPHQRRGLPDGRRRQVIRCNTAFARLLQRPFAELIGTPLIRPACHSWRTPWRGSSAPAHIQIGDRHYRVRADSGAADAAGSVRAWVFGDVTERERQQAAVRRSEEEAQVRLAEIEAVYRSAPAGLCVLDTEFRYVRVNERLAEIIGLPVEAHRGRTCGRSCRTSRTSWSPGSGSCWRAAAGFGLELRGETRGPAGHRAAMGHDLVPAGAPDGRIVGINIAAEEVTEQRRLEAQLLEAQRLEAVGRLAGGVAHETNNR